MIYANSFNTYPCTTKVSANQHQLVEISFNVLQNWSTSISINLKQYILLQHFLTDQD